MLHQGENVEERLIEQVRGLQNKTGGRSGLHLHLSKLNPKNRQTYHLRITTHMLTDAIKRLEGDIYLLDNSDIVVLCKGVTSAQLDEMVQKVRYFFSGDALFSDENGEDEDPFSTLYDLSIGWRDCLAGCEQILSDKLARQSQKWGADDEPPENVAPLDPGRLARLRDGLSHTDASSFLRRQPVCQIEGSDQPQPLFYELYVRIADLQRVTLPDVDLLANRWLFLHLTQVLDDRMLTLLTKYSDEYLTGPISINLNIDTIFLPKFLSLTNRLDPSSRRRIAIEFQLVDVISDLESFIFAKTFLKESGFMVTLDGICQHCLPDLVGPKLGVDLIKVNWDSGGFAGASAGQKKTILGAIEKLGPERIVFTRCSNQTMIEAGQKLGVHLFQGRYVDRIVNPNSRRVN